MISKLPINHGLDHLQSPIENIAYLPGTINDLNKRLETHTSSQCRERVKVLKERNEYVRLRFQSVKMR